MRVSFMLAMVAVLGFTQFTTAEDEMLIKSGAKTWKYFDGDKIDKDWAKLDFDDSKWKEGEAPLGYGDDDIKQEIPFGDDENDKRIVAYFRYTIEVKDHEAVKGLAGTIIFDDAAAVYLNGEEVFRLNLAKGDLKDDTLAQFTKGGEVERFEHLIFLDGKHLKKGKNVIGVRVHQASPGSSDLAMNMQLKAVTDEELAKKAKEGAEKQAKELTEQIEQQFEGQAF